MTSIFYVFSQFDGAGELPADCALVFGAAVHKGNRAGPGITRRTHTAVDLYHRGDVRTLIFTGGKGSAKLDAEAKIMQKLATSLGVHQDDIRIEDRARSTWQNLLYSKSFVEDCNSIVAISDRYHLGRISFAAHRQGWGRISTYPAYRTASWYFELRSVVREGVAILYYFLK